MSAERINIDGALVISPDAWRAWFQGREVEGMTRQTFRLLLALATTPERVCGKDELYRHAWGIGVQLRTRTLDTHACRLRRALEDAGATPGRYVRSVWGVGYALMGDGASVEPEGRPVAA